MIPAALLAALLLGLASAGTPSSRCDVPGGSCPDHVATYLLQARYSSVKTVPPIRDDGNFEDDYAHDSSNPLDSEYDAAREPAASRPGATRPRAMVQNRRAPSEEKNATAPATENATASNASDANATAGAAETPSTDHGSTAGANSTRNITNGTDAASSSDNTTETNSTTGDAPACFTKRDERVKAWTMTTSPEGTPCVFGVDPRDEGGHCIYDKGEFGSNGWCFTSKDGRYWGSCAAGCPLYGAHAAISSKIDALASDLKKIAKVVVGNGTAEEGAQGDEETQEA